MSSLGDRVKIANKGKGREVIGSIQNIIDCSGMGCNGGDSNAANKWIHDAGGIPDITCQQYQAKNGNCTAEHTCMNCGGGTLLHSPFGAAGPPFIAFHICAVVFGHLLGRAC